MMATKPTQTQVCPETKSSLDAAAAREMIARIIDPAAFENWNRYYLQRKNADMLEPKLAAQAADYQYGDDIKSAYARADAVLALLLPPSGQEADASLLICSVNGAIEAIERGSTSAPVLECLKAARAQFLEARAALPSLPERRGWRFDIENMPLSGRFEALGAYPEVFRHLTNEEWVIIPRNGRMFMPYAWRPHPSLNREERR